MECGRKGVIYVYHTLQRVGFAKCSKNEALKSWSRYAYAALCAKWGEGGLRQDAHIVNDMQLVCYLRFLPDAFKTLSEFSPPGPADKLMNFKVISMSQDQVHETLAWLSFRNSRQKGPFTSGTCQQRVDRIINQTNCLPRSQSKSFCGLQHLVLRKW